MSPHYISIGFAAVFGVGVVSGMLAQRVLTPEPEVQPNELAAPASPRGETLSQMDARRPRDERPPRDDRFDWADVEPAGELAEPGAAPPPGEQPMARFRENPASPVDRVSWTNREAWIEQRRIEQQARMQNIRSNLVDHAKLNEDQATRFDVLVTAMNMRLVEQSRLWRDMLEAGTMSRSEVRARAMKEIGSVITMTYDELDRNLPPEWRTETTNQSVDLWTFIDPEIWREMRPVMGRGRPRPPQQQPDTR